MPDIRILLVVLTIGSHGEKYEKTYPMPDMKTCQERLEQYKPSPAEIRRCEYSVDY